MALADYFYRSAVATSQLLGGYDEDAIREVLELKTVGIALPSELPPGSAAIQIADLSIRLLARLYPRLSILSGTDDARQVATELARTINPRIDLDGATPDVLLAIGPASSDAPLTIHVGSDGWDARVSTHQAEPVGAANPFGAGAAACLGAANVFRAVFMDGDHLDSELVLSTLDLSTRESDLNVPLDGVNLGSANVLVGLGAVGQACLWALSRTTVVGTLHLVDHEHVELSNLQRYVLAGRQDDGAPKTQLAERELGASALRTAKQEMNFAEFISSNGHHWDRVAVALDSARDRRGVQASLPRWIANAWTQAGDLGVSTHDFTEGACLACLYLPDGPTPSEDKRIAAAFKMERPDRELQIRNLLHDGGAPTAELLDELAQNLEVPRADLEPYSGRPLRDVYVEGICGGALLPLSRTGSPTHDVHVPVAHQSALAGVLLAGRIVAHALDVVPERSHAARIDVSREMAELIPDLNHPIAKDPRGICICQDPDYQDAYALKYAPSIS
jgi:hypothetical protein